MTPEERKPSAVEVRRELLLLRNLHRVTLRAGEAELRHAMAEFRAAYAAKTAGEVKRRCKLATA